LLSLGTFDGVSAELYMPEHSVDADNLQSVVPPQGDAILINGVVSVFPIDVRHD
jgi:hypothetical protein